jgi:uncharacterized membrane protein YeaQ/YmgE (transglycosylase-associated protein family)
MRRMTWLAFTIAGTVIGAFVGHWMCGCHDAADAVGVVLGLLFAATGGVIGLVVGSLAAAFVAVAAHPDDRPTDFSATVASGSTEWVHGVAPCPRSGLWLARVADDHSLASDFNVWGRTARVTRGERFPDPARMLAGVTCADVMWKCVDDFVG